MNGELGKASRDAADWHARLDQLEFQLDGARPPSDSRQRWQQVHPAKPINKRHRARGGPTDLANLELLC